MNSIRVSLLLLVASTFPVLTLSDTAAQEQHRESPTPLTLRLTLSGPPSVFKETIKVELERPFRSVQWERGVTTTVTGIVHRQSKGIYKLKLKRSDVKDGKKSSTGPITLSLRLGEPDTVTWIQSFAYKWTVLLDVDATATPNRDRNEENVSR